MKKEKDTLKDENHKNDNPTNTSTSKDKTKSTKKKMSLLKKISITIFIILIIAIVGLFFLLKTPATQKAYLTSFSGDIQVFTKNSWQTPTSNQELSLNDKIKTSDNGYATLVLMEKAIVNIEPNSEIEILTLLDNNIKIKQNSGNTWNKYLGILGVDTYEVETPNAVASVRGTSFNIKDDLIIVTQGVVNFKTPKEELNLEKYQKSIIDENGDLKIVPLTKEEKEMILKQHKTTLNDLKNLRLNEIEKNKFILNKVKDMYELTDEDINKYLDDIDNGYLDDNMLIEKSPFKTDSILKVKKINDEIKTVMNDIKKLEEELNNN